jgi:hypothetical protein
VLTDTGIDSDLLATSNRDNVIDCEIWFLELQHVTKFHQIREKFREVTSSSVMLPSKARLAGETTTRCDRTTCIGSNSLNVFIQWKPFWTQTHATAPEACLNVRNHIVEGEDASYADCLLRLPTVKNRA